MLQMIKEQQLALFYEEKNEKISLLYSSGELC